MVPRPVPGESLLISLRYTLRAPHLHRAALVSQRVFTHFHPCVAVSAGGGVHLLIPAESVALGAGGRQWWRASGQHLSCQWRLHQLGTQCQHHWRRTSRQFQPGAQHGGVHRASACCVCGTSSSRAHSASTSCGGIAMQKPEMLRRRSSFNCCCELQNLCIVWGDCIACAPAFAAPAPVQRQSRTPVSRARSASTSGGVHRARVCCVCGASTSRGRGALDDGVAHRNDATCSCGTDDEACGESSQ